MSKIIRHFKRWNKWRKKNIDFKFYQFLVLIGVCKSPSMQFVLTDEEEEKIHKAFLESLNNPIRIFTDEQSEELKRIIEEHIKRVYIKGDTDE